MPETIWNIIIYIPKFTFENVYCKITMDHQILRLFSCNFSIVNLRNNQINGWKCHQNWNCESFAVNKKTEKLTRLTIWFSMKLKCWWCVLRKSIECYWMTFYSLVIRKTDKMLLNTDSQAQKWRKLFALPTWNIKCHKIVWHALSTFDV